MLAVPLQQFRAEPLANRPWQNVVELVLDRARRSPAAPAFVLPSEEGVRVVRYGDVAARTAEYVARLDAAGVSPGARVLLLMRPDADLYALVLAVLAGGMTLVVVDGNAGARRILELLDAAKPDAVIASAPLMRWWPFSRALRRAKRFTIAGTVPGARRFDRIAPRRSVRLGSVTLAPDAPAIVSFSSGNTGSSKAITRTHGVLSAQHRALCATVRLEAGDVNLPGFPLATLHNLCCGTTSIIPAADLRAMAVAEPAAIAALIERQGVTSLSGAPTYVRKLARYFIERGAPAMSVRELVVGGGPVGRALCADIRRAFPRANARIVYGATEAEPIACISVDEVAATRDRDGFLVGHPVDGSEVCLLDDHGNRASIGEVAVRGRQVATQAEWHRTGDIGRFDTDGRLWLLGRVDADVTHQGCTLHPYAVEADALSLPGVRAAAVVVHSRAADGELVIEPDPGIDDGILLRDVRVLLASRGLPELSVRVMDGIPMDARHRSKVARRALVALLEQEGR
jgi:acyl-coenzyme A synthetase/AMP-(fatty) acid ligase